MKFKPKEIKSMIFKSFLWALLAAVLRIILRGYFFSDKFSWLLVFAYMLYILMVTAIVFVAYTLIKKHKRKSK